MVIHPDSGHYFIGDAKVTMFQPDPLQRIQEFQPDGQFIRSFYLEQKASVVCPSYMIMFDFSGNLVCLDYKAMSEEFPPVVRVHDAESGRINPVPYLGASFSANSNYFHDLSC